MAEGFVQKTIRRSNLGSLVLSAIGILIILALAASLSRYFFNFFKGPFAINQDELVSLEKPEDELNYYYTVQGEEALDTGFQYVITHDNGSESVEHYYFALPVLDRLLLVRTSAPDLLDTYTGTLMTIPNLEQANVITEIVNETPGLAGVFLPVMLDTGNFKLNGYFILGGAVIAFMLCGILFIAVIRHATDPLSHPIMRMLAAYGDPESKAAQVDTEIVTAGKKIAAAWITPTWLVVPKAFTFRLMRLDDILWIYKQVVTHRRYGIVIGRTYSGIICDRNGKTISVTAKEPKVDELLSTLHTRVPFAFAGEDLRIRDLWRRNRQDLAAEVDRRKRAF